MTKRLIESIRFFRGCETTKTTNDVLPEKAVISELNSMLSSDVFEATITREEYGLTVCWRPTDSLIALIGWGLVGAVILAVFFLIYGTITLSVDKVTAGGCVLGMAFLLSRWIVLLFRPRVKKALLAIRS